MIEFDPVYADRMRFWDKAIQDYESNLLLV